jgi:hypothetical protein
MEYKENNLYLYILHIYNSTYCICNTMEQTFGVNLFFFRFLDKMRSYICK